MRRSRLQRAGTGLTVAGSLLVVWVIAQLADGWWYQRQAARAFLSAPPAQPAVPAETDVDVKAGADAISPPGPTRIEIPRLDLAAMIVDDGDAAGLRRGVCRITGTADFVAATGNVGLAAHRDSFFRNLRGVAVGDTIRIATSGGCYLYVVEWTRVVEPQAIDVLDPTPERALTLVTCYPFGYVGRAPNRFVVRARGIDREPAGGADAVHASTTPST